MNCRKPIVFFSIFAAAIPLFSGCMPMQMKEEGSVLGITSKQTIQEKDYEINKLKELLSDQQGQLRELNDQLNECKGKK